MDSGRKACMGRRGLQYSPGTISSGMMKVLRGVVALAAAFRGGEWHKDTQRQKGVLLWTQHESGSICYYQGQSSRMRPSENATSMKFPETPNQTREGALLPAEDVPPSAAPQRASEGKRGRITESQTLPTPSHVHAAVPTVVRSIHANLAAVPAVIPFRSRPTIPPPPAAYYISTADARADSTPPMPSGPDIDEFPPLTPRFQIPRHRIKSHTDLTGVYGAGAEEDAAQISHPSPRMRYW
ncbi:hypothetical protein DFH09DRAFT_1098923 [Mycena vulgaris]|nr:hypothetical protein DFH09DRAFT_1098923 [Mycena vulgaris]